MGGGGGACVSRCRWYAICHCSSASMSSLSSLFSSAPTSSRYNVLDQMLLCGIRISLLFLTPLPSPPSPSPPPSARSISHTGPLADRHLVSAVCLSVRFEIELCPLISLMCLAHTHTLTHTHSQNELKTSSEQTASLAAIMI